MSDKKNAYDTLAKAIALLEDGGMQVETAQVTEVPDMSGMSALFGGKQSTSKKAVIILDPNEEQKIETPDEPDDIDKDGAVEIDVESGTDNLEDQM